MKNLICFSLCILLLASQLAHAECTSTTISYGQISEECIQSNGTSSDRSVEFTQVPYNANGQVSRDNSQQRQVASLEQSVKQAQETQSPFKPTHTQLNQVKQLLEYAQSQGCSWGGKFDEPILICPN